MRTPIASFYPPHCAQRGHIPDRLTCRSSMTKRSENAGSNENLSCRFPSILQGRNLVAPYCAIPRDYLSDTPLLRAMGFLLSQHGQLGAIPPPPFLSVSPLEHMRSRGAIPPPQKGYLSDTSAIPFENKANRCDTPLYDTISQGYCAIWGVSRTGPLRGGKSTRKVPPKIKKFI